MAAPTSQKLSNGEISAILKAELANALGSQTSSDLSDQRIRAYDYYMGDMSTDMPSEEGLSGAVSTDVQDTVEGILPILLDMFVSTENVVVFKPTTAADSAAAKQETDYINYVFYQQNSGFLVLYSALKDAIMQKNGFVKWWMEKQDNRTREHYENMSMDAFALLVKDTDVTVVESTQTEQLDPMTMQMAPYVNCTVDRVDTKKRLKVEAVPPEEIFVSRVARTMATADYWAHVRRRPQADVIRQFPDKEEQIKASASSGSVDNWEAFERQTVQDTDNDMLSGPDLNKDMRLLEVQEHYIRLAIEDDGVARRYRITTVGSRVEIMEIEEMTSWPIATGTPIIMTHRVFGRSVADLVVDIQQIKTSLLRAMLNNAYFANNQRMEVSESHASDNTLEDLLNNRVGGIVRTKVPGGLNPIPTQSIGNWVLPAIEYADSVRENRTGISRYSQGLDADSLNQTATGISKIMDAAEMRVKLMARIFAETLIVDMMRGMHETLQMYGEEQEEFELSGSWVTVNPREWKKREHMKVTLPMSAQTKAQLIQFFQQLLTTQQAIVQEQGGPNGPLVTNTNVFNTLEEMVRLAGLPGVEPYFSRPDPNAPPPPPKPDPKMVEAQSKAQATQAGQQADQQMQTQKLQFEQQLEMAKLQAANERAQQEFLHKSQLEQMKFHHEMMMGELRAGAEVKIAKMKADGDAENAKARSDAQVDAIGKQADRKPANAE